jgi:hypothetical protein
VGSDLSEFPRTLSARLNVHKFPFREVSPEATGGIFACGREAKWKSRIIPEDMVDVACCGNVCRSTDGYVA